MYRRKISTVLQQRLMGPRSFIQVVMGPRQTGKTTAIKQAVKACGLPCRVASADSPRELAGDWIDLEWRQARQLTSNGSRAILVLDEIQKVRLC